VNWPISGLPGVIFLASLGSIPGAKPSQKPS
jgi:hypothetical protein